MTNYQGSCCCGAVRFEVRGEFDSFYLCHCHRCQKDTGSAHAANLFSQSATLLWLRGEEVVKSFTLPGTRHSKGFCRICGSALPAIQSQGLLVVPAGALDSEARLAPTARIFMSSNSHWNKGIGDLPTFPELPE
ncbi:MAG: GFA family protein [Halieaceae bacterium]|jgi:hypothetical protein|nr:GFA family protein [Halieaceae bacterium]